MYIIRTEKNKKAFSILDFFRHLSNHHIFESSATLSYYFLFSAFPFAIFISAALSTLQIKEESLVILQNLVPIHILKIFEDYLREISLGNTETLIMAGTVLTAYSMAKAIQTMKRKFRLSYGLSLPSRRFSDWMISIVFVLLIMVSFYAMLILIVAGNRLATLLMNWFPILTETVNTFQYLKLFLITLYLFFVLFGLYYLLPGIKLKIVEVLPGTLFALVSWVITSYLFSFYLDHFSNLTTLYGSLGTIIALLSWLFLTNLILLIGVHINSYPHICQRKLS